MYQETAKELIQFIENSPTCFHACLLYTSDAADEL